MALFSKSLPSDVLAALAEHERALGLSGRPRVLAWAKTDQGYLAGTPARLAEYGPDGWTSWAWHDLLRATWSDDGATFRWVELAKPRASHEAAVLEPGRLPELVMERIEQTIVVLKPVVLAQGKRGTLTGRRPATESGPVTWTVVPGPGVDLNEPAQAAAASELLERAKRDWN